MVEGGGVVYSCIGMQTDVYEGFISAGGVVMIHSAQLRGGGVFICAHGGA